jgi:hypothetical protein
MRPVWPPFGSDGRRMAPAFLVVPLVDGHMAVRAFAVLFQHAVALRMAGRAAVYLIEA